MRVPFFDATREEPQVRAEVVAAMERVLASGAYILGPEVAAFEEEIAAWIGVPHAIGVASGTDALWLALEAVGVGQGDAVLTSPFTFFATASAILRAGATPVFADIDLGTFNLEPGSVEEALAGSSPVLRRMGVEPERIRAVVPVHLYGQAADLPRLRDAVARAPGRVAVIEDAAQALGAKIGGRAVGTIGDAGCFSFFPTKNLGTAGDGGLVTTADDDLAAVVRSLRAHGSADRYRHDRVGTNSRLDAIHAAILRARLPHATRWIDARRANARRYDGALAGFAAFDAPTVVDGAHHTYNQYTLRVTDGRRDAVRAALQRAGVGSAVYYPTPVHLQPALAAAGYRAGDYPVAERACDEVLSLPVSPGLSGDELDAVVDALRAAHADAA